MEIFHCNYESTSKKCFYKTMRLLTSNVVEDRLIALAVPTLRFGRQARIRINLSGF